MALPEPPPNFPRIVDVQDPGTGHYVVMVRMPTQLASKFPDKPWGTQIENIGLSKKDSDQYSGYTLVDVEPLKGSSDLYWIFQKLDGPVWTTQTLGQDSLVPAKYRRLITTTETKQEVVPGTAPDAIANDLVKSVVQDEENTGKAIKVNTVETINESSDVLHGGRTSEWGILSTTERVVNEGSLVPHAEGIAQAQINPFGNGKAEESKTLYPTPGVDGIIAELSDQDQDPQLGIVTNIRKILVTNGTAFATRDALIGTLKTPSGSPLQPWWVEAKGQDQHHSILIASKVDLSTLPAPEVFWDSDSIRLPDALDSIGIIWNDTTGGGNGSSSSDSGAEYFSGKAEANASAACTATIAIELSAGFSGLAKARVTRTYVYGPPDESAFVNYKITPAIGSVSIHTNSISKSCYVSKAVSDRSRSTSIGTSERIGVDGKTTQIGPFLSNGVTPFGSGLHTIATPIYTASNQGAFAYASVTAQGTAIFTLPSSNPSSIASGDVVARYQKINRWRLGIWIVETIEVYAP